MSPRRREVSRRVRAIRMTRRVARSLLTRIPGGPWLLRDVDSSSAYARIDRETAKRMPSGGWQLPSVARRQHRGYVGLVEQMYAGAPRLDLTIAAEAVRLTGLTEGSILEIGCGSGYYGEILSHLLERPIRYIGLDSSGAMIQLAREEYAAGRFIVADAAALPLAPRTIDIALNGNALMHMAEYERAIAESRRVARRWCIFHTVPVVAHQPTVYLRKLAYGGPTVEVVFNEPELLELYRTVGLVVRHALESFPYDLEFLLGERTTTRTYVCELAE